MDQKSPDTVLSVFLASSVHDMKNSVNLLTGSLETLLETLEPQSFAAYPQLAQMLFEVRRVNGNLTQLLTLYKLGQQRYPFDPQDYSITQFVNELAGLNRPLLESRNIRLYLDFPRDEIWHFDEDLVGGIVNHAINNAIRYTEDKIRLAFAIRDNWLEIHVEDNGPGYPEAILADQDGSLATNFRTGSTGLGLYFSREVAKLHKHQGREGSVRLENGGALGGGCFILQLP
ncbi:MAG: HAMP domain-containing histidine kinase [Burkholderiales bacterium]|nr:HAMP domain-containing histidine kinase [Burkholderiales bacterium]